MNNPSREHDRVPPRWGVPITKGDYAALDKSWITPEVAEAAMLRRVDTFDGREIVGQRGNRDCSGLLFSYYSPGEAHAHSHRIRRDNPELVEKDGVLKPNAKYLAAPGSTNRLYFPPGITLEQFANTQIPIVVTEGEKKALALSRLAFYDTVRPRFIPIAISGVWNWRGTIGKAGGPNGERLDVKGPINDLNRIPWDGRPVSIVFDANVHTNDSVQWARKGICRELTSRKGLVRFVSLPEDCGANGIDDLLASWGPERVLELFANSVSGARLQVNHPPQFRTSPEGILRVTARGEQLSQVPLTTFVARIITNVELDDGVETKREFEIEAEIHNQSKRFTIPASEFINMNWPIERLGSAAIIFPNQREYAKTAIQSLSLTAIDKCLYTHTGWRNIAGQWVYLHAGGAICAGGVLSDASVRFSGALSRYELQLPADPHALVIAVKASLQLLTLAPASISFPLLAATYRASLGGADFAGHIVGASGGFKSELAALFQQHYGATMRRVNLPAAWSSTANALEVLAFHAKDALLTIDDFAPPSGGNELVRYHSAAERVFRAAGNQAGRGRLDSTAKLRESKSPRALILSTGEDVPRGQSVRSRLLILDLSKGDIDSARLGECQHAAWHGLYAQAMGGFIQWFAGRYDDTRKAYQAKVDARRAGGHVGVAHARTPEMIASLQAGFGLFIEFAVGSRAINAVEGSELEDRCWDALTEAASAQARHQGDTEPTSRFLAIVRSSLSTGRAHLAARDGGVPEAAPESYGWRRDDSAAWRSVGDCIGWTDDEDIYLDPNAAYRLSQIASRDMGESLAISEATLRKRLHEKHLLASTDEARETLTVRRKILGSQKNVLHLRRETLLPQAADDEPDGEE